MTDNPLQEDIPDSLNAVHVSDDLTFEPTRGDRIEAHWPMYDQFHPSVVHDVKSDKHNITYDEGDTEELDLSLETWCSLPVLIGYTAFHSRLLERKEQDVLSKMLQTLGNK